MSTEIARKWWKEAVVYQVYPASFRDTNGDGLGDVNGITSKVDYLKKLGVDVVWVSPIYDSPQADMGYDISDYKKIYPPYGTIEDVDRLIKELHQRDMKLVMDLVVNHTSDQHPWFLESKSSLTNPKRDWYIWKPPRYDAAGNPHPPNNWNQILGEANSAWQYDAATKEYYLCLFTPEQPDLNWESPDVRAAVNDVLRFWLDRGVSGFRMDVINLISKVQTFPDAEVAIPGAEFQPGDKFFANGPRLHEFLRDMKREVLDKYDTMTVGEMPYVTDTNEVLKIVHGSEGFLNMIFNFELVEIDNARSDVPGDWRFSSANWSVADLRRVVDKWQRIMVDNGGWNSLYCENHDQPRSVSHFCDDSDEYRGYGSKLICLMQSTLCGTPYVYQGQELGMRNLPTSWSPAEYKDIESVNYWKKIQEMYPNDKAKHAHALHMMQRKGRDNARTPVQWDSSANGGFCPADVKPWMRVNDDYPTVNAAAETKEGAPSVYNFWSKVLAFRKQHVEVFAYGSYELVNENHPDVLAFKRTSPSGQTWVSALNFTGRETEWQVPEGFGEVTWEIGNYEDATSTGETAAAAAGASVKLRPWEGRVGKARA